MGLWTPKKPSKMPVNSETKWRRIKVLQPLSFLRRFHVALNVASPLGDLSKLQLSISVDRTRCSTHPGIHAILSLHLSYRDEKVEVLQCMASCNGEKKTMPYTIQVNGLLDFEKKIMSGFWLLRNLKPTLYQTSGFRTPSLNGRPFTSATATITKNQVNLPGPEPQAFGWNLEAW